MAKNITERKGYLDYLNDSLEIFRFLGFLTIVNKFQAMIDEHQRNGVIHTASGYLDEKNRRFHDSPTIPLNKVE